MFSLMVASMAIISLLYLYLGLTVDANFLGASQAYAGFTLQSMQSLTNSCSLMAGQRQNINNYVTKVLLDKSMVTEKIRLAPTS